VLSEKRCNLRSKFAGRSDGGAYRMYAKLADGYRNTLLHYMEVCGSANKA